MDYASESLKLHRKLRGKLDIRSKVEVNTMEDLSLAYTPGVAEPCLAIKNDPAQSYELTGRWNTVAVVTDGSAVLGLGDIGPEAGMPVMEGKAVLFKEFGNVDAVPLCIRSKNVDEIVQTVSLLAGSFGGINLEDIASPRCFEIERRLKEVCDIPVFHDDQHGTAVVVAAALTNALKVVKKELSDVSIVLCGFGAAGSAITKLLLTMGAKHYTVVDREGILTPNSDLDPYRLEIVKEINPQGKTGTLADALVGADVFIGVSAPGLVTTEMVASMNKDAIVFGMANPTPEIFPDDAKAGGAAVVATGRSDYPNQVNNVMVFPGMFRGAFDVRASDINDEMKIAAVHGLASLVSDEELSSEKILPLPFDPRVKDAVAKAVAEAAKKSGVAGLL